jgi:double zinc ribbon protein
MRLDRLPFFARAKPVPPPDAPADDTPSDEPAEAPPPPPPLTPVSARQERRALVRRREVELRDVGGLAVEMIRRARFKPDLLVSRCNDVLALEQRIWDLDSYLATAEAAPPSLREGALCRCGAPLVRGAHFCSHCGRPALDTPAVVACVHCGNALPAEANFCSFCGNAVPPEEPVGGPSPEDTLVREDRE